MSKAHDFVIENGILKDYTGTDAEVVVPEGVTGLGFRAFYKKDIIGVKLPKSLKSIGREAFYGCRKLKSVSLPYSIREIKDCAFVRCPDLSEFGEVNRDAEIADFAFDGCDLLADQNGFLIVGGILCRYLGVEAHVTVPEGIKKIGGAAFDGRASVTKATIPEGVTEIGDQAFFLCENLASVELPDSLVRIGEAAFRGSSLTSLALPAGVKEIGDQAFLHCEGLADENGFVIVRNVLYSYAGDCTEITVPDGVSHIGAFAFSGKEKLRRVTLPESVTRVGFGAFENCENLARVDLPEYPIDIGDQAFRGCRCFADDKGFIIFRGILFDSPGDEAHVKIPQNVTRIASQAFSEKERLISVAVRDGLKEIANDAFCDCPKLTHIFRE